MGITEGMAVETTLLRRADLGLATPWEEPCSEPERKLAKIWQEVLGIDVVGASDDFFELGGDSFAATALAAEIEAVFASRFTPADIINLSTVAKQAGAVAGARSSHAPQLPSHLVLGHAGGSQPPVFVVHGSYGFSFFKQAFIDEVGQDRPVYLFQAPGLDGRATPAESVEQMASLYVDTIREIQPTGSYRIVAMCAGSFIALEMCNRIRDAEQTVSRLILLDPYPGPSAATPIYSSRRKGSAARTLKSRLRAVYKLTCDLLAGRNGTQDQLAGQFEEDLNFRAKKLRRLRKKIRIRRAGGVDWVSPEEGSYSPETMLEAAVRLQEALRKHVPRPYSGKATLLVASQSADKIVGEGSFWHGHLGEIDYHVCGIGHQDVFGAQIAETARFVRNVLNSPG